MKKCKKCGKIKEVNCFYRSKIIKSGRLNVCNDCSRKYKKQINKLTENKYGIGIRTMRTFGVKLALEVYDKYKRKCFKLCKKVFQYN